MESLFYFLSVLVGLGSLIAAAVLLWAAIEGVYFLYCKARGIKY
jgi:hypothetical protein